MIKGWFPYPPLSIGLLALWLLLNQSVSPGQIILGSILAISGPLVLARLDVPELTVRRPWSIIRVIATLLADMAMSNLRVAREILFRSVDRVPGFVEVPLQMRSQYGLAALACIITATPGTSWVSYDPASGTLIMHVLDLRPEDDWPAIIKTQYEQRLMEIFE